MGHTPDEQIKINESLIEITQNLYVTIGQITEALKVLDTVNQSFDRRLSLLQEQLKTIAYFHALDDTDEEQP